MARSSTTNTKFARSTAYVWFGPASGMVSNMPVPPDASTGNCNSTFGLFVLTGNGTVSRERASGRSVLLDSVVRRGAGVDLDRGGSGPDRGGTDTGEFAATGAALIQGVGAAAGPELMIRKVSPR